MTGVRTEPVMSTMVLAGVAGSDAGHRADAFARHRVTDEGRPGGNYSRAALFAGVPSRRLPMADVPVTVVP